MHDELGNHRVVVHGDFTAVVDAGIHTHAAQMLGVGLPHGLLGRRKANQAAGRRQEVAERVFGVDTALDGPAVALYICLGESQLFTRGHTNHLLDQIQAGDALGDRVLDLKTGIHLQEVEVLVFADHELHGAGALVLTALASATACSPMALRVASLMKGLGASSITFW